jgi:hypothetical protein
VRCIDAAVRLRISIAEGDGLLSYAAKVLSTDKSLLASSARFNIVMQPCKEVGLHSYLEMNLGAVASAGISRRHDGIDSCMLGREGSGVAEHGKRTGRKDAATQQEL